LSLEFFACEKNERYNLTLDFKDRLRLHLSKPDYAKIRRDYKSAIYGLIWLFLTGSETPDEVRKKMEGVLLAAFILAYNLGLEDGGGATVDQKWIKERITKELVFISALVTELYMLRQSKVFDAMSVADARSTGYTASLDSIYNIGKVTGAGDELLTFDGIDGRPPEWPCPECLYWKGKTRPASFWITHDLVPYPGNQNYTCKTFKCQHGLFDANGKQFTV
jgi:hypothetical protein